MTLKVSHHYWKGENYDISIEFDAPTESFPVIDGKLMIWYKPITKEEYMEVVKMATTYDSTLSTEEEDDGQNYTYTIKPKYVAL